MKKINILVLSVGISLLFGFLFTNCTKQPKANFTTDKDEYLTNEIVKLTNSSVDAITYKWVLPDGQTSSSTDIDYKLNTNLNDTILTFKLDAFSKKGKKTSTVIKSILVKASGQVTIRTTNSGFPHKIYIDNIYVGSITEMYYSNLGCNANSCLTTRLKTGKHEVLVVSDSSSNITGSIWIYKGDSISVIL